MSTALGPATVVSHGTSRVFDAGEWRRIGPPPGSRTEPRTDSTDSMAPPTRLASHVCRATRTSTHSPTCLCTMLKMMTARGSSDEAR